VVQDSNQLWDLMQRIMNFRVTIKFVKFISSYATCDFSSTFKPHEVGEVSFVLCYLRIAFSPDTNYREEGC
jgi:hypothetical protein